MTNKHKEVKRKRKLKTQVCWMPWVVGENRFESWIFGSKKDCDEWIGFNQCHSYWIYESMKVRITEIKKAKKKPKHGNKKKG